PVRGWASLRRGRRQRRTGRRPSGAGSGRRRRRPRPGRGGGGGGPRGPFPRARPRRRPLSRAAGARPPPSAGGPGPCRGLCPGTLRVGPGLLAAAALPIAVHLALAWLLTGLLSWSVAGAGLARLAAALAAAAGALAVARGELGGLVSPAPRRDRALLRAMFTE